MITIIDKSKCCGCGACEQICPKKSISLIEDKEGFLYPEVDIDTCIKCNLCEKVCPVINQNSNKEPLHIYAAINKDENIRYKSSSGGVFNALSETVIMCGGVVFGARFDKQWNVVHDYTDTIEGIKPFRTSKYVQSYIGDSYKEVEKFLKLNRKVLFVGSPCQISGLKLFLRRDYDNLLLVDFLCHGVPSPKVWRKYLSELTDILSIKTLCFRDKQNGWKSFGLHVCNINGCRSFESLHQNTYLQGFLNNLYLRPSCHSCPSKKGQLCSDITIADFWGVDKIIPGIDDDNGVSLVLVNTSKGEKVYSDLSLSSVQVECENLYNLNGGFHNAISHRNRERFFRKIDSTKNISKLILRLLQPSFKIRLIIWCKKILNIKS